jgi:hypothetical protein
MSPGLKPNSSTPRLRTDSYSSANAGEITERPVDVQSSGEADTTRLGWNGRLH